MGNSSYLKASDIRKPSIFIIAIALLLPFNFALSIAIVLAFISSFIFIPFNEIKMNLRGSKILLLFSSCYLLYLLAMIHTSNQSFGFRDLEYKLSIFFLPLLFGINGKLNQKEFSVLKFAFVLACFIAAIASFFIGYYNNSFERIPSYIELSALQHPTYFSIYINLVLVIVIEWLRINWSTRTSLAIGLVVLIFFFSFNFLLNSKIGIIISLIILGVYLLNLLKSIQLKKALPIAIGVIAIISALLFSSSDLQSRFSTLTNSLKAENISKDSNESTKLRILIWNEAIDIFKKNPWIGVGTGDTKDELVANYSINEISYAKSNKLNCHNQFLEWLITFGLIGTSVFLFSIILPFYLSWKSRNRIYIFFIGIIVSVFLVESFLEKEAGVVFFTYFNSLLFINFDK